MTQCMLNDLNRAFATDNPPVLAVAISNDGHVFLAAEIYESYAPKMPAGLRNSNYLYSGVFELIDEGGYCTLRPINLYHSSLDTFYHLKHMAQKLNLHFATSKEMLDDLLKNISADGKDDTA